MSCRLFEEDLVETTVVLKVDLPPYVDVGAIRVPQTLTKRRLILQTGLDVVCGPGGEVTMPEWKRIDCL